MAFRGLRFRGDRELRERIVKCLEQGANIPHFQVVLDSIYLPKVRRRTHLVMIS
jgi:hypothetical protein